MRRSHEVCLLYVTFSLLIARRQIFGQNYKTDPCSASSMSVVVVATTPVWRALFLLLFFMAGALWSTQMEKRRNKIKSFGYGMFEEENHHQKSTFR